MHEVTSIEKLKEYSRGDVVALPPFSKGKEFYARLKRPSILAMVKSGKIGNSLLSKTNELFMTSRIDDMEDEGLLSEMLDILESVAAESFVEPTYKQIKEAGIQLTDEQMMFVFNYSQEGVKALEPFRTEQTDRECSSNGETVS